MRSLLCLGGALLLVASAAGTAAADTASVRSRPRTSEGSLDLEGGSDRAASPKDILGVPASPVVDRSDSQKAPTGPCGLQPACLAQRS